MAFVDESLLSKLVDKFGVDKEEKGPNKTRLWGKVTKEYNSITGNNHTKARLNKKWQNIKHQRKLKRQKLFVTSMEAAAAASTTVHNENVSLNEDVSKSYVVYSDVGENMWNVMGYAFRDLFLYLIKKYDVDDVTNPRIKNELWKNISRDFHETIDNLVIIKHEKFTKKWQNWKQYNKSKNKPHPLMDTSINLDFDVIREKIRKMKERVKIDAGFAAFLARESDEIKGIDPLSKSVNLSQEADKLMTSTSTASAAASGPSTNAMSNKQLEREVYMEALRFEQERFKIMVENGQLEKDKLTRESNWMEVQLQMAQAELAIKKQQCQEKGIIL